MDPKLFKEFEERLRVLHDKIGGSMNVLNGELKNGMRQSSSDALPAREEADVLEAEGRIEESEIQMVEEALERIRSGMFGICLECGCDIDLERLQAVPYAKYCVKCQEEMEKNGS